MPNEIVKISVGLRLDSNEIKIAEQRKDRILTILEENGIVDEIITRDKIKYIEFEFRASIGKQKALGHHNFDSRLNKSWPEGAGAAWIEER
jgi:hypothetical protein